MAKQASKSTIKIRLTPEQREHLRQSTGQGTSLLKLQPEELEERIAPGSAGTMSAIQNLKG